MNFATETPATAASTSKAAMHSNPHSNPQSDPPHDPHSPSPSRIRIYVAALGLVELILRHAKDYPAWDDGMYTAKTALGTVTAALVRVLEASIVREQASDASVRVANSPLGTPRRSLLLYGPSIRTHSLIARAFDLVTALAVLFPAHMRPLAPPLLARALDALVCIFDEHVAAAASSLIAHLYLLGPPPDSASGSTSVTSPATPGGSAATGGSATTSNPATSSGSTSGPPTTGRPATSSPTYTRLAWRAYVERMVGTVHHFARHKVAALAVLPPSPNDALGSFQLHLLLDTNDYFAKVLNALCDALSRILRTPTEHNIGTVEIPAGAIEELALLLLNTPPAAPSTLRAPLQLAACQLMGQLAMCVGPELAPVGGTSLLHALVRALYAGPQPATRASLASTFALILNCIGPGLPPDDIAHLLRPVWTACLDDLTAAAHGSKADIPTADPAAKKRKSIHDSPTSATLLDPTALAHAELGLEALEQLSRSAAAQLLPIPARRHANTLVLSISLDPCFFDKAHCARHPLNVHAARNVSSGLVLLLARPRFRHAVLRLLANLVALDLANNPFVDRAALVFHTGVNDPDPLVHRISSDAIARLIARIHPVAPVLQGADIASLPPILQALPGTALNGSNPNDLANAASDNEQSDSVPREAAPSETIPKEAAPSETIPNEAAPSETIPNEAAPNGAGDTAQPNVGSTAPPSHKQAHPQPAHPQPAHPQLVNPQPVHPAQEQEPHVPEMSDAASNADSDLPSIDMSD